jgi:hypothetical protein
MPSFRISPIEETFPLDETDAAYGLEPNSTHVRIRQATQAANERIESLYNLIERKYNEKEPGMVYTQQRFSIAALYRTEAFETIISCDIEDEGGKLLFGEETRKSEEKFREAWGKLPDLVVREIIKCVHKVNVSWAPEGEVL